MAKCDPLKHETNCVTRFPTCAELHPGGRIDIDIATAKVSPASATKMKNAVRNASINAKLAPRVSQNARLFLRKMKASGGVAKIATGSRMPPIFLSRLEATQQMSNYY
jgi:hypothetical protein